MLPDGPLGRAGRRPRSRGARPGSARTTASFSAGEIVQVEYTSVPPGASARGARAQDRALQLRQPPGSSGPLAPARVGARGERAEVRARRVDEHAVVGGRPPAARRRRPCAPRRARAHARGRAPRAPARGPRGARRRRRPAVLHQRGEVRGLAARGGAQVEHALAGPRARGSATTAIAARDCGMNRPCSHSGEPNASNGRLEHEALGQAVGRAATRRAARAASSAAVVRSALARSAGSAARLPAAISARAALGRRARRTTARRSTRDRSAAAPPRPACASGSASTSARPSRAARRSTALTSPAPRGAVGLGQLDRLADRRVRGRRGRGRRAGTTPSRSAASTAGRALDRRARPASRSRGRAWRGAARRRRRAGWRARGRARRGRAAGLAVQRPVGPGALLEDAAQDREGDRARGRRRRAVSAFGHGAFTWLLKLPMSGYVVLGARAHAAAAGLPLAARNRLRHPLCSSDLRFRPVCCGRQLHRNPGCSIPSSKY